MRQVREWGGRFVVRSRASRFSVKFVETPLPVLTFSSWSVWRTSADSSRGPWCAEELAGMDSTAHRPVQPFVERLRGTLRGMHYQAGRIRKRRSSAASGADLRCHRRPPSRLADVAPLDISRADRRTTGRAICAEGLRTRLSDAHG